MLWIFPPVELIGQALNKLKLERVTAIVMFPKWIRYWQPMKALTAKAEGHANFENYNAALCSSLLGPAKTSQVGNPQAP